MGTASRTSDTIASIDQTRPESGREEARNNSAPRGLAGAASGAVSPLRRSRQPARGLGNDETTHLDRRLTEQHDDGVGGATWVMFGGSARFCSGAGWPRGEEREEKAPGERGDTVAAAEPPGQRYNTLPWPVQAEAALASSGFVC